MVGIIICQAQCRGGCVSQSTMLQGRPLGTDTTEDLIHAAKAIGWCSLYPLLTELAHATCDDDDDWIFWDVVRFLQAFQTLHVLLGELLVNL